MFRKNKTSCWSPVLEFRPLTDALSQNYRVITLEPFGYGFSDEAPSDREMATIVDEFHECVKSLGYGEQMGG